MCFLIHCVSCCFVCLFVCLFFRVFLLLFFLGGFGVIGVFWGFFGGLCLFCCCLFVFVVCGFFLEGESGLLFIFCLFLILLFVF